MYSYAGEGIPELKDYFREYVLCSWGQKMKIPVKHLDLILFVS